MIETKAHRPIRSFVRRERHLTPAQERALEKLWSQFGIDPHKTAADFAVIFGRDAPVILEVGFGNGETLAATAVAQPQPNYLGIEVHRPGIGHLLRCLEANGSNNVRILQADAKEVFAAWIPDESLSAVNIFFPDPWPKKRHHKRRLVQPDFSTLIARKLKPGGYIHLATDWQEYAEHMAWVMSQTTGLIDVSAQQDILMISRLPTRFERRGRKLGHKVQDLVFQRGT